MEPNNLIFLLIAVPVMCIIYYMMPLKRMRNIVLVVFSIALLSIGKWEVFLCIIVVLLLNYLFVFLISKLKSKSNQRAKRVVYIGVLVNVLLLICIRYAEYIFNLISQTSSINIKIDSTIVPIGLIFVSLYSISYLINTYLSNENTKVNLVDFILFLTFFPKVFVTPNIMMSDFIEQIHSRKETPEKFITGIVNTILGVSKIAILSNLSKIIWDNIYSHGVENISGLSAILGITCVMISVYFLLLGLSDISRGLALLFGFNFDNNFLYPFMSDSFTGFWNRWYVGCANWFKISLYDPLQTGRKKHMFITNIIFTWTVIGWWCGGEASYIIWGVITGIMLCFEVYIFAPVVQKLWTPVRYLYTYLMCLITFAPIGCTNLKDCFGIYKSLFFGNAKAVDNMFLYHIVNGWPLLLLMIIGLFPIIKNIADFLYKKSKLWKSVVPIYLLILVIISTPLINSNNNYLYASDNKISKASNKFVEDNNFLKGLKNIDYNLLGVKVKNNVFVGSDNYLIPEFIKEESKYTDAKINAINNFSDSVDVNQYMAIIPSKGLILDDKKRKYTYSDDELKYINNFENKVDEKVKNINTIDALVQNKNQNIYYKTDASITSLGANIVYKTIMQQMDINTSEDVFESVTVDRNFQGDLVKKSGLLANKTEELNLLVNKADGLQTSVHYVYEQQKTTSPFSPEKLKSENKLDIILHGPSPLIKINSTANTSDSLLVISDTSNNNLIPFFATKFSKVVVVDSSLYKGKIRDLIQSEGINNMLYLFDSVNMQSDGSLEKVLKNG